MNQHTCCLAYAMMLIILYSVFLLVHDVFAYDIVESNTYALAPGDAQSPASQPELDNILDDRPRVCQTQTILATSASERFDIGEHTVIDLQTGLMWARCVEGLFGEMCERSSMKKFTWEGALMLPFTLNSNGGYEGYSDWRLPNIRELNTLVELQCENPAINQHMFPGTPARKMWSSSPYHFYTHYAWYVDFFSGAYNYTDRTNPSLGVRLVRYAKK